MNTILYMVAGCARAVMTGIHQRPAQAAGGGITLSNEGWGVAPIDAGPQTAREAFPWSGGFKTSGRPP